MSGPLPGIALHPVGSFLRHAGAIAEQHAAYIEVSPETLWGSDEAMQFFVDVQQRSGLPFVAHGLGLSLGTPGGARVEHLRRMADSHEKLGFSWYSEHLGFWKAGEREVALALPLPHSEEAVQAVCENLAAMRDIVPTVAFENWAGFFAASPVANDPGFFAEISVKSGANLLLDLHNVEVHCSNNGGDPDAYVDGLALDTVLEIHLAGGSLSEPRWLKSGRVFRLDSHDNAITEWQWATLQRIIGRCTNLRGVTIERLPDGFGAREAEHLSQEFTRLSGILDGATSLEASPVHPYVADGVGSLAEFEHAVLTSLDTGSVAGIDSDGLRMTGLIVKKLRFQRLVTDAGIAAWYDQEPRAFHEAFSGYHAAVPAQFHTPSDEVAAFKAFVHGRA